MAPKSPAVKTFLPAYYQTVIGSVIVHWAFMENSFDEALHFLRLNADALAIREDFPRAFDRRQRLFKDSAKICFADCLSVRKRYLDVAHEVKWLGHHRDLICHGRWGVSSQSRITVYMHSSKGPMREHYTLDRLKSIRDRIKEANRNLIYLSMPFFWEKTDRRGIELTSDERQALRNHRRSNHPTTPTD